MKIRIESVTVEENWIGETELMIIDTSHYIQVPDIVRDDCDHASGFQDAG